MKAYRFITLLFVSLLLQSLPASPAAGAAMDDYCIQPPFIQGTIPPNLLLMIDNSASMYDPAYQDTLNIYCSNAPTTSCTTDAQCPAAASCVSSVTTTTTTTYSAKACTADAQCPNSAITYTAKICSSDANCSGGSKCAAGRCKGCDTTTGGPNCTAIPKCNGGFCKTCNTTTGAGDCSSSTTTTYSPVACASDDTCSAITTGDVCNNKCNATRQCYDATYSSATTYSGYFDSAAIYSYDFINNKFTSPAAMPGGCSYSAGTPKYVCVNTSGSGTSETISTTSSGFVATGNFLNWLTASKFDIEKQILTGGKFDTTTNVLSAESRGCSGRKFIKAVPGVNLTFSIHGGQPGGVSTSQNQATEYGQTYIQIYAGVYNTTDCLNAMNDWMTLTTSPVNLGSFQNDTKGCVGAGNAEYNATNMWNHILHDCYNGILGKAGGYSTNLGPLEGECKAAYDAGVTPDSITDPNSGISICSSVLSYEYPLGSGNFQQGYLGSCYNSGTGTFDSPCDVTQMRNFCLVNINTNPVVDPTTTSLSAGSSAPGFIMEQGLMNTVQVGELTVKIEKATAPTGLIQEFQNTIRFGAATFNNNGSGTECGITSGVPCYKACSLSTTRVCYFNSDCPAGESCIPLTRSDGGKVITYISNAAGDHGTPNTLISDIDAITATTWTPFAEAFYTSIGYFARTNAYSVTPATSMDFRLQTGTCSITTSKVCKSPAPDATWQCPSGESCVTGTDKGDYDLNMNPSQARCQKNNILLITDGQSTADVNSTVTSFVSSNTTLLPSGVDYDSSSSCYAYSGTRNIEALSWLAQNRNIQNIAAETPATDAQRISTYVVYSGAGTLDSATCSSRTTAQLASLNGCSPDQMMCKTARYGGGSYYLAKEPSALRASLRNAFTEIAGVASSGTAASVLASGEGSGANLVQSIFYPKRSFVGSAEVKWIGTLANMWYYIDPRLNSSSIREDTVTDRALKLTQDRIVEFTFNPTTSSTGMNLFADSNGDGIKDSTTPVAVATLDSLKYLWEAGRLLFLRTAGDNNAALYAPTARTIYTNTNDDSDLDPFTVSNAATLKPLLGFGADATTNNTSGLIRYVRGNDAASIDFNGDNTADTLRPRQTTVTISGTDVTGVWKLGDTINSTPKLVSWTPLNQYDKTYSDYTYKEFYSSSVYTNRGMVFVGANDGMLHAFKLGLLGIYNEADRKATLGESDMGQEAWAFIPKNTLPYLRYQPDSQYCHLYSIDATPTIFDASIEAPGVHTGDYSVQTKTASSWRTVLIGAMRYGGACRSNGTSCSECVKTPISGNSVGLSSYFALDITDPEAPSLLWEYADSELGFSSTGPAVVKISAKTHCSVAAATTCNSDADCTGSGDYCVQDTTKNGRWFVVIGSGPSGYVSPGTRQLTGVSEHNYLAGDTKGNIKLHVLDLKTGNLLRRIDAGESAAFAGSFTNATIDIDGDYSDDAFYFGFTARNALGPTTAAQAGSTATTIKLAAGASPTNGFYNGKFVHRTDGIHETRLIIDYNGTTKVATVDSAWQTIPTAATNYNILDGWNTGGVKRLFTEESLDPGDWKVSDLIRTTGPVTSSVVRLLDSKTHELRVYFGTGRNFYKMGRIIDDAAASRRLYGVKDPCIIADGTKSVVNTACYNSPTTVSEGSLGSASANANIDGSTDIYNGGFALGAAAANTTGSSDSDGWYIQLQALWGENSAERVITDPLATQVGVVFFTTTKPSTDVCSFGGKSYIWAVRYDTGGTVPSGVLKGKAMIQLSTGAIEEIDIASAFIAQGNRRTAEPLVGLPPLDQSLNVPIPPAPIKKILHMQKK